jgi:membrane protein
MLRNLATGMPLSFMAAVYYHRKALFAKQFPTVYAPVATPERSMTAPRPEITALVREAFHRLIADEAFALAGNIAFRIDFSIFPFLIFLTTLAGFFGNEQLAERIVGFLLGVAPSEIVRPLIPEIRSILTIPRTGLLSLSAIVTIWSAMGGVDSVRVGLNRAYDLKETRKMLRLYGQSVVFIIGSAVMLLALALLIVLAPLLFTFIDAHFPSLKPSFVKFDPLRYPVAILLLTAGVFLCHLFLPARRGAVRDVVPGVVLTVVVWIGLSAAFSYYLVRFNTFASTYASLSGFFAAMFFVYLAAVVLILGGEVNRVLALHRSHG